MLYTCLLHSRNKHHYHQKKRSIWIKQRYYWYTFTARYGAGAMGYLTLDYVTRGLFIYVCIYLLFCRDYSVFISLAVSTYRNREKEGKR